MRFHVTKVGVFRLLLFFVRHMDQEIEPVALGVALDNCLELLFVKSEQFLYGNGEFFHQAAVFFASQIALLNWLYR